MLLPERLVCMHGLSSYDNWWMVALCVAIMRKNNSCIVLYNTQDKHLWIEWGGKGPLALANNVWEVSIFGQDPNISMSNQLRVVIFWMFFIVLRFIIE